MKTYSRRTFLENSLKAGLMLALPSQLLLASEANKGAKAAKKLTILHTNDTHARIEPFPSSAGKYAGLGGIARRAKLVEMYRNEDPHLLLLDAGDIFQGTPYFNYFGGELDLKLMSKMGYDATTIGNHEFDNGLEGFAEVASYANFPFLSANYDVRNTPLSPWVDSSTVIERNELRIGLFGLGIELQGLVLPSLYGDVRYRDPIMLAKAMVRSLKEYQKCDLVICLSHLGYDYSDPLRVSDKKLAQSVPGIDIILGGHTHTFLDEPYVVEHDEGQQCLVHQVGFGGIRLGKIEVYFSEEAKAIAFKSESKSVKA